MGSWWELVSGSGTKLESPGVPGGVGKPAQKAGRGRKALLKSWGGPYCGPGGVRRTWEGLPDCWDVL